MIHPDDQQPWMIAWENALRTRSAYAIKPRVRLAADQEYVGQIEHVQPVRTPDGEVLEWVLVATMHDSRNTRIEGLRRALVRKNEQLMAVAHEMRGPLAAIVGAVELLENRRSDPAYIARVRALLARQLGQHRAQRGLLTRAGL
jgi:signal transduction histidine kinase